MEQKHPPPWRRNPFLPRVKVKVKHSVKVNPNAVSRHPNQAEVSKSNPAWLFLEWMICWNPLFRGINSKIHLCLLLPQIRLRTRRDPHPNPILTTLSRMTPSITTIPWTMRMTIMKVTMTNPKRTKRHPNFFQLVPYKRNHNPPSRKSLRIPPWIINTVRIYMTRKTERNMRRMMMTMSRKSMLTRAMAKWKWKWKWERHNQQRTNSMFRYNRNRNRNRNPWPPWFAIITIVLTMTIWIIPAEQNQNPNGTSVSRKKSRLPKIGIWIAYEPCHLPLGPHIVR